MEKLRENVEKSNHKLDEVFSLIDLFVRWLFGPKSLDNYFENMLKNLDSFLDTDIIFDELIWDVKSCEKIS